MHFHEHDAIVAAIVNSDAERAFSAMRNHIIGAGVQVIEHFSRLPESPAKGSRPSPKMPTEPAAATASGHRK